MKKPVFKLWHSLLGTALLLLIEMFGVSSSSSWGPLVIMFAAALGAAVNLYVATEIIEQVREPRRMLELLSGLMMGFIVLFAFQYLFLISIEPTSFPGLTSDPTTLLLHSTMIFALNPLYLPGTGDGRLLLLINTLAGLGLVFFILQNIWQFRQKRI